MCSILGFLNCRKTVKEVEALNALMSHRGPDNASVLKPGEDVYLAHNRLAIIGLESSSNQPMSSADGRFHIVFNGEIYNYLELRTELAGLGHVFKTKSDTEVLLTSFMEWKEECLQKLNGMFAFAIYDTALDELFIARDRVGEKPLYYFQKDGGFAFSSELEPLAKAVSGLTLDELSVDMFFMLGYIAAPKTIYTEVSKLRPAHYGVFKNNRLEIKGYWKPVFSSSSDSEGSAIEKTRELLTDSIRLRLRSDVPVGAFLSGGIDSSLVVAFSKKLGISLETYTIGFAEKEYDESAFAIAAAQKIGVKNRLNILDRKSLAGLGDILRHFWEPFADASAIPTFYVSRYAAQSVKVVFSGDGGDELYAGYNKYKSFKLMRAYRNAPFFLKKFSEKTMDAVLSLPGLAGKEKLKTVKRVLLDNYEDVIKTDLAKRSIVRKDKRDMFHQYRIAAEEWIEQNLIDGRIEEDFDKIAANDFFISLPDDMLTKVDRMSMAHSLEVRTPFLDHRLIEYALSLKTEAKMPSLTPKHILKKLAAEVFGESFVKRPKSGFVVPVRYWLGGSGSTDAHNVNNQHDYLKLVYKLSLDNLGFSN